MIHLPIFGRDCPVLEIDRYVIKLFDLLRNPWNLQGRETDSEAIPVKYSRKAFSDYGRYSRVFDRNRCLFTAGPSSKVSARDKKVTRLDFLVKLGIKTIHRILRHLNRIVSSSL